MLVKKKKRERETIYEDREESYLNISSCQIQNPQVGPGNNILDRTNEVKTSVLLLYSNITLHQRKSFKCPLETDGICLQHLRFSQLEQI